MSDYEELREAQAALAKASHATGRTAHATERAQRATQNIKAIVEPNGYVDRFRSMLRGA